MSIMDNKNTQNNDLEKEDKESAAEEKNIVTEKEIKEVSLEEKLKETDEKLKESKDLDTFLNNFEILEKDLISVFEKNKIKKIDCLKEKFDPNIHQAMLEIEDDKAEPGLIIQEIQPGYMFGDRLLRPSFVGVSKKKSEQKSEKNEKKED